VSERLDGRDRHSGGEFQVRDLNIGMPGKEVVCGCHRDLFGVAQPRQECR